MEMNPGDFLDRWTILRMKARLDPGSEEELRRFDEELDRLFEKSCAWRANFHLLISNIAQLAESNAKIWVTEAAIRKEYEEDPAAQDKLSLEEIGRRALEIRRYNKLRVEAKQAVDALFGACQDRKVDHASQ